MICRYCKHEGPKRPRGLCGTCYKKREIRAQYPAEFPGSAHTGEPTAEELKATVEEQMRCLPEWWGEEE